MEVSVIIPNFNGIAFLDSVLGSLEGQTLKNFEVILVDNGSADGSCSFVSANYPWVHIIELPDNFGFCRAVNEGIKAAKAPYVLLLNNDTEVITKGWMKELLSHCQRPEVGMVGAKLYFPDNTIQSAGTIIGMGGMADHAFVNMDRKKSGYMHRAGGYEWCDSGLRYGKEICI